MNSLVKKNSAILNIYNFTISVDNSIEINKMNQCIRYIFIFFHNFLKITKKNIITASDIILKDFLIIKSLKLKS